MEHPLPIAHRLRYRRGSEARDFDIILGMFRKISDFLSEWKTQSEGTLKTFRELTDQSLNLKATPDTRSLGDMAWHITCSIGEIATKAGLPLEKLVTEQTPRPADAVAIVQAYETSAKAAAEAVKAHWTDDQMADELPMYSEEPWKKGFILWVLVGHEVHHRGQMTILMRMAGLKVPGMFGPSREEWAAFGMAAPN